jgi:hypothetical protein
MKRIDAGFEVGGELCAAWGALRSSSTTRGFGDSEGTPDLFHPARQLEDWAAAIGAARGWPGVDPELRLLDGRRQRAGGGR